MDWGWIFSSSVGDRFDAFVHNALFFDDRGQLRQVTVIRPFSLGVDAMGSW
jgi:hypothetical protein